MYNQTNTKNQTAFNLACKKRNLQQCCIGPTWDNKSEFAHFIRGAFDVYIFLLLTKKHAEINIQDQE